MALTLHRGSKSAGNQIFSTTVLLLATRLIRSWNQTGQKFAGEPDIVKVYLNTNPTLLWCLIGATYFWVCQNLIYGLNGLPVWFSFSAATGLVLAAFTFKVAFTLEDAPELVTDFARRLLELNFTKGAPLVTRALTVFIGIGLLTALTIVFLLARRRISVGQSGKPSPSFQNPYHPSTPPKPKSKPKTNTHKKSTQTNPSLKQAPKPS
jgi:ethanolamine phosphate transferase 2 subunit G